jgi:hypothetical protein
MGKYPADMVSVLLSALMIIAAFRGILIMLAIVRARIRLLIIAVRLSIDQRQLPRINSGSSFWRRRVVPQ